MRQRILFSFTIFASTLLLTSCKPRATDPLSEQRDENPAQAAATLSPRPPHQEKIWTEFDGNQALTKAKAITDFRPRPAGANANAKARQYLINQLTQLGWQTTQQRFTGYSPDSKRIEFCNLIARFSHFFASVKRFVIGSHFDTVTSQSYLATGASDGAAGSAILLELARVLALDPQLASRVELLFLDGNAPFHQLNLNDGLFGSRFYIQMLQLSQRLTDIRGAVILENVGSSPFQLSFPPNSDQKLADEMKIAAQILGFKIEVANRPLLTDHVPFEEAGIPTVALLEADAPQVHTADDTPERLGADSLARTGRLVLYFLTKQELSPP